MPNMTVMAPKDENELRRMLAAAVRHDGPIALRYPRGAGEGVALEPEAATLAIGKAELLAEGDDVAVLAIGRTVPEALAAHRRLAERGIRAAVVNCRFVKPIDAEMIAALAHRVPRLITVEEHVLQGGFGSAVLELLCDQGVAHAAVERIGLPDGFVEHGPPQLLRAKYGVDAAAIVKAADRLLRKNGLAVPPAVVRSV
jgi:1-deoxy-D-xylulose-5-phosphate synthase